MRKTLEWLMSHFGRVGSHSVAARLAESSDWTLLLVNHLNVSMTGAHPSESFVVNLLKCGRLRR